MADKTLNQLTEITALADDDLLLVRDVTAVEDFKITMANLKETSGINQRVIYVDSVADLEARTPVSGQQASLSGDRARLFAFSTANLSTEVTSDPAQGKYVAPSSDPTGASGAWVSLDGTVLARHFGILPSSGDNSGAWQDLLNFAPSHVHFDLPGTYVFLSSSDHDKSISITGVEGVVIDCTDAGFTGGHWTKVSGSATQIENLGSQATRGDREVTFASAPSLSLGDLFMLYEPADSSWSGFRTSYRAGEFCKAASIATNTVGLSENLYDTYLTADVDVYKVSPVKVSFGGGIRIIGSTPAALLIVEYGEACFFNAPDIYHSNNSCLQLIRCYDCAINSPKIYNEGDGGDDYGLAITNCQNIKAYGGSYYSRRHGVTTGGDNSVGSIPCRNIIIEAATVSNDPASGVHAADFHGNTEYSKYVNCKIFGGATWQGRHNGYIDCEITAMAGGMVILSAEILGGQHYARNCELRTYEDPSAVGRGVVDVGGNSSAITSSTDTGCTFDLRGSKFALRNSSASTVLLLIENDGTTVPINELVEDIEIDASDFSSVLRTQLNTGTAASGFCVINNIKALNGGGGRPLVTHVADAYLNFPHKLQRQSGSNTVTTSTGSPSASAPVQTFGWAYPRVPVAQVGRNNRGYIGNRIGVPYGQPLTATQITPTIATDDATNFSSATTVDLQWNVSIDEI